ncbi:hypothetical protein JBL43_10590 [Aureibaculum sp. A20]|uniref:DUF3240 domain-containing protein n=1 Tax=Aureibaculum flavum TaxID=2795986 RepID=A0ABS0WRT3_9FLAO|nr:hypothetical protein [Aureibaculum flavum]MBJ2174685.1 hypothetical protein [Aureibaculum flavum]
MKLLIITAISAFEKEIKSILKNSEVNVFSYQEVKGFRNSSEEESVGSNWFAGEINESESLLFYAFVKKENVDQVFSLVEKFNNGQKTLSKVHLAVMDIERSN